MGWPLAAAHAALLLQPHERDRPDRKWSARLNVSRPQTHRQTHRAPFSDPSERNASAPRATTVRSPNRRPRMSSASARKRPAPFDVAGGFAICAANPHHSPHWQISPRRWKRPERAAQPRVQAVFQSKTAISSSEGGVIARSRRPISAANTGPPSASAACSACARRANDSSRHSADSQPRSGDLGGLGDGRGSALRLTQG